MNRTSPAVAALLSAIVPGLGHAYLRRTRAALVFALPVVLLAIALIAALAGGIDGLLAYVITPTGAMTVLVLVLLTGAWRLISIVDAVAISRRLRGSLKPAGAAVAALLIVATVGLHASAAYLAYNVYDAGSRIFVAAGPDDNPQTPGPGATLTAGQPTPTDDYLATPLATPPTKDARINILLTGVDSAESRSHSLTDTLLVVSVDPTTKHAVMLSIPRDVSNFPLYDGRTFTGKINSLMTWARNHPKEFPDGPFPTLIKEIGFLIGVPIHYYAAIDLEGFRRMIDEVGGVTVDNPRAINDPRYDWLDGTSGFTLPAGTVRLDGRTALAYARSRQGLGDSDFTRAARQQQLLVALRKKLSSPDMIPKLPAIIQAAGDTVRTNLPTGRLDEFIGIARTIRTDDIDRYVLGPPYATHPPTNTTGGIYTLKLDMGRIAKLSRDLFGGDSRYATQ